jgi:hypothetical protein
MPDSRMMMRLMPAIDECLRLSFFGLSPTEKEQRIDHSLWKIKMKLIDLQNKWPIGLEQVGYYPGYVP